MVGRRNRSVVELVGDAVAYWAVDFFRRRAARQTQFPHIVVPIDDLLGLRIIATGRFELTQFDTLHAILDDPQRTLGVDINRNGMFVDVGANIGLYTMALAPIFARTVAFEPNPITFKVLEANLLLREVRAQAMNEGLSDRNGEATISFPRTGHLGWATLTERHAGTATMQAQVTLRTLDEVDAVEGWTQPISLLKIDVEGHEPEVLRGAQRVLNRDRPVVLFEVLGGPAGAACIETLRNCGYDRFFTFRRALGGPRGGIAGHLTSMIEGAPITISEIDASNLKRDALVCATAPAARLPH